MCGIAGAFGVGPSAPAVQDVRRVLGGLAHRGPDGAGMLVRDAAAGIGLSLTHDGAPESRRTVTRDGTASGHFVLGHRRLAIIDPSPAGRQPMVSADGRYAIGFNGVIYNYIELRDELESRGHRFASRSDTEVLLAAFAEWHAACLERLVGMFAFVVLDLACDRVFLARDHFGMKPLYYARHRDRCTFASEIPTLLDLGGVGRRILPEALFRYLRDGTTDAAERTLFAEVRALPAAHYLEADIDAGGDFEPVEYWRPTARQELEISFAEAAGRLRELFFDSVTLHLRSDRKIGTLLSGGVDSSSIVMTARRLLGRHAEIRTFSYIPGPGTLSEEPWIDTVNRDAGAIGEKISLEPHDWTDELAALTRAQGEPFGSIAIFAQHRLFRRAAAAGVGVVLDGQGGDELFGGYVSMWTARVQSLVRGGEWIGAAGLLRRLGTLRLGTHPGARSLLRLAARRAVPSTAEAWLYRCCGGRLHPWIDARWCDRHDLAFLPPWKPRSASALRESVAHSIGDGGLPALLRYEDRNSMAHSVEARLPFLTTSLVDFVLSIPEEYIVSPAATTKSVLREAMRGTVPDEVLDRRDKVGFAVPLGDWLPNLADLDGLFDILESIPALDAGVLRGYREAARGASAPGRRETFVLWRLAGLAAWAREFDVEFT